MDNFSDLPVPEGFERVAWEDAGEGGEVFVLCLAPPGSPAATRAAGPYRVHAPFRLRYPEAEGGHVVADYGERLLRRRAN